MKTTLRKVETSVLEQTHLLAWVIAFLVVFAWGVNFVLAKYALNQFDVGSFNFVRFGGMVVVGWSVLLSADGVRPVEPRDRVRLLIVSVVGFCGYVFGFSIGLHLTSAFSASLLLALVPLVPLWIVALTSLVERRAPSATSLVALALASAGIILFVSSRTSVLLGWGDFVSLVVAGLYAAYLLLNRSVLDRYSPFTLTTYGATLSAVPILALTAHTMPEQNWSGISATGWLAMAWVIIGPVFVAWSVWNWVQQHVATTRIAPLLFLVSVVGGYTAWLILDEPIQLGQIVGAAIVIGGLILNQWANSGG